MAQRKQPPLTLDSVIDSATDAGASFLAARYTRAEFELALDDLVRRGTLNRDFTLTEAATRQARRTFIFNQLISRYGMRRT